MSAAGPKDTGRNAVLRSMSVEDIEELYTNGDITAGEKQKWLREKAKLTLNELVEGSEFFTAVFQKTLDNIKEGWDNLTEGIEAAASPGETKEGETPSAIGPTGKMLLAQAQIVYGSFQVLNSVFDAFGSVTGTKIEQYALRFGASPGLAWWIGLSAEVGTGALIPANLMARTAVKGAQAAGKATKAVAGAASGDARLMTELAEALARDGIQNAKSVVFEAGKEVGKFVKLDEEPIKAVTTITKASFLEDAKKYADEIGREVAVKALPKLMKKFGITFEDLKTIQKTKGMKGTLTTQELYGHLKAMEDRAVELSTLARKALLSNATEVDKTAFAKGVTELFTGPSDKVSYTKEFQDLLAYWDPVSVAKGDINAAMRALATDLYQLRPKQIDKLVWRSQDHYMNFGIFHPYLREIYTNILMTAAWAPTFVGNSLSAGGMILERLAGGHPVEAMYMMKGMALSVGDAMQAFGMAFKTGGSRGALPGAPGRLIRSPSDSTIAMDAAFKVITGRASLYADALRASASAPNKAQFIRNYMANPPANAVQDAFERAYRATYQNDLGQFASLFRQVAQSGPGSLWFTFFKSPINLVKYGWDRTPGIQFLSGRLYQDVLRGGAMADDAIGRLTLSNMQAIYFWELAKEGFITGGGPTDPALRKAWLATHEPYSVKTEKGWVSYRGYDPISMPIGIVADLAQIADQLDPMSLEQGAMAASFAFMQNIANRTAWRTMSDIVEVAQGVTQGENLSRRDLLTMAQPAIAAATGGPVGSRATQAIDPVARDARNLTDQFLRRTPGYSDTVPPVRDGYGDPVIPPQNLGPSWFGYFNPIVPKIKPEETDPIKVEGARVQARLPYFKDFIGRPPREDADISPPLPGDPVGVPISPQQRDRLQQIYRNIIRNDENGLQALIDSPEYKEAPLALQRQLFNDRAAGAKELASKLLQMEDIDLGKKVQTNSMERIIPLLPQEEREGARAEAVDAIDIFEGLNDEEKDNLAKYGVLDFIDADKPKVQEPISILGYEVIGERRYDPK